MYAGVNIRNNNPNEFAKSQFTFNNNRADWLSLRFNWVIKLSNNVYLTRIYGSFELNRYMEPSSCI